MGWVSFLAAVVLTLALVEGLYILRQNPHVMANRLFFCMTACIAVWLLGLGLGYGSRTGDDARRWFKVASPGFIFLHCCTLHFVLAHTGRLASRAWRLAAWLSYLPSVLFQFIAWAGVLVFRGFSQAGGLWIGEPDFGSASFTLLMIQYLSYYGLSIGLLVYDALRSSRRRDRRQRLLIVSGIGISVLLFNVEPFLLPLVSPYRTILVSPLFSIVLVSAAALAIRRYHFLSTSAIAIDHSTLDHLSDAIVLFDSNLQPVYTNTTANFLFPAEKTLEDIVTEASLIRSSLRRAEERKSASFSCVLSSKAPGNACVDCRFSLMRDTTGELESILLVGIPVNDTSTLHSNYGLTKAESRVVSMLVEGKQQDQMASELGVSIRTVKAHCAHIYQKLRVRNKIELIRLLGTYKLLSNQAADQSALPLLLKKNKNGY
jgi:DNA-binding CsgD family transcriptional regulator